MTCTEQCGSIWRRWDMHLHTPETKKNSNFTGSSTEEQWSNFYSTIRDYIGDGTDPLRSIAVIGITDYLSLDNYFKVKNDKELPECIKLIIPNIEARMIPVAKESPINIHFLFDPSFDTQIESQFLANLSITSSGTKYNATKSDLIRLGKDHSSNNKLDDVEAYKKGIEQFILEPESIRNVFKDKPELRNKVLIGVSNKSGDGVPGARNHSDYSTNSGGSQLDATVSSIYQLADFVFSARPKDREYFLGRCNDNEEKILKKYGSLMPCLHGCDAHENSKVFAPDSERYCWIKSDPTFEGLKQVLYEPKDRVCISSTYPSLKSGYNTIDRVEISGNDDFSCEPIYFNENLTCIIGGKSTGKSLLLHNMALALDKEQALQKSKKSETKIKDIESLKVIWRDGHESGFHAENGEKEHRKIIYIPQTYLNKLSDSKEESTEIDTIIKDIILQEGDSSVAHECMQSDAGKQTQTITANILELLKIDQERAKLHAERMEKGDEKGVGDEIVKFEKQLRTLSESSQLSEQDISDYQESLNLVQKYESELKHIEKTKEKLSGVHSIIEKPIVTAEEFYSLFNEQISKAINVTVQESNRIWKEQRDKILDYIDDKTSKIKIDLTAHQEKITELQPKIEEHGQIDNIASLIRKERQKLATIKDLCAKLDTLNNKFEAKLQNICDDFLEFRKIQEEYAQKINTSLATPLADNLECRVEIVFRSEHFKDLLSGILNNKTYTHFKFKETLSDPSETNIHSDFMKELIRSMISPLQQSLSVKGNYTVESGLRAIFTNWYNVRYIVKLDNDDISVMSPGKKALVLLQLLISLAESKCPILIDQPEDDLDNRSIFGELIEFIKKRKIDRQIIIVTHNANIVVGSDAELVIVANQQGKNSPNAKHRFEYRAGSIENNETISVNQESQIQGVLNKQGIQGHICDILEGGLNAFELRGKKYRSLAK